MSLAWQSDQWLEHPHWEFEESKKEPGRANKLPLIQKLDPALSDASLNTTSFGA